MEAEWIDKLEDVTARFRMGEAEVATVSFGFVAWAPALRLSAMTGARVGRLGGAIEAVLETRETRIPTGRLNRNVRDWTASHPPPVRKGRRPKVHYAVQAGTAPPTFVVFLSGGELGEDYFRYLENKLRGSVDFVGSPIHFVTRSSQR